jgi:hypothetical protein
VWVTRWSQLAAAALYMIEPGSPSFPGCVLPRSSCQSLLRGRCTYTSSAWRASARAAEPPGLVAVGVVSSTTYLFKFSPPGTPARHTAPGHDELRW